MKTNYIVLLRVGGNGFKHNFYHDIQYHINKSLNNYLCQISITLTTIYIFFELK